MISIVIPAFNEEKDIEETVRQFAALHLPHEVIVADTLSTDRTVAIAKRCADAVTMMDEGGRRGVSHGRNDGAKVAKGEFIVFLDVGTLIPDPDRFFKEALARFGKDPKLVALSTRIEIERRVRTWSDWAVYGIMNVWFLLLNNIFQFGIAAGKFQMIRMATFRKTEGFNERLPAGEDADFFRHLSTLGRTRIVWGLVAYHTGRRFHQLGAWKTLYRWIRNALSVWFYKKAADKGWEAIR